MKIYQITKRYHDPMQMTMINYEPKSEPLPMLFKSLDLVQIKVLSLQQALKDLQIHNLEIKYMEYELLDDSI